MDRPTSDNPVPPAGPEEPPKSRSRRRGLIVGGAVVAAALALAYYLRARHFEETDDAQVDGDLTSLSPRVSSNVTRVFVVDNQRVAAGDTLVELDPAEFELAVERARAGFAASEAALSAERINVPITETSNTAALKTSRADLASAEAQVAAALRDVAQLRAQLAQGAANNRTLQLDRERAEHLIAEGAITQAAADASINTAVASTANLHALEQALASAKERVSQAESRVRAVESQVHEVSFNSPRQLETHRVQVEARIAERDRAKADLDRALLDLSYCQVVAPVSGVVGRKTVSVGDRVSPGQQLLAISQIDRLWITANFRETQLRHMRPEQPATVHVDATGATLRGSVESLGGATGSHFSVLPPENATGNYVKVVQRIPVRIALEPGQPGLERLRPGMSVEPTVRVR